MYGDRGNSQRWYLEVPFQGTNHILAQKAFHKATSEVWITVEWIFKEIKMYFTTVDFKRKMKIMESPVGLLYLASMMLCNFRNCIYSNQVSQYFDGQQSALKQYVNHK